MTTFTAEYTDTIHDGMGWCGNYAWVRRETFTLPDDATDRQIVRAAKAAVGLTGVRCRNEGSCGDETVVLRPYGSCTVLFIIPEYD